MTQNKRVWTTPSRDNFCNLCNWQESENLKPGSTLTLSYSNNDEHRHTTSVNLCLKHAKEMAEALQGAISWQRD